MNPRYTVVVGNEGEDLDDDKVQAYDWGKKFVESIMNSEPETMGNDMRVMRAVFDLETGITRPLILRKITEPFWRACIDAVNTPEYRIRIAAVGTPGIGKTTSTPWLIRMLLKEGHTVVYLIQTEKQTEWYYEFIPQSEKVTVKVYPETLKPKQVPSLKLPSSYYVVDPGKTKTNCDPGDTFQAKFILVPSPDVRHWGESEFAKHRGDVIGRFRYLPTWSIEELLVAWPFLRPKMTEDEVYVRFHQFGGVPRHVFALEIDELAQLQTQNNAVKTLSVENARDIALGVKEPIEPFGQGTKSAVLGFRLSPEDTGTFEKGESCIISTLVSEKIYSRFQSSLWSEMVRLGSEAGGGIIFEMITRHMIANGNPPREFECRRCVGKSSKEYYHTIRHMGTGNKAIRQVTDPFEAARTCANVVFHPISSQNELYDFVFTDSAGHFHVCQATIGSDHSADAKAIIKLEERAGGATNMSLYYLVPSTNFPSFVTKPVHPEGVQCNIYHVSIPNPGLEKRGPAELMVGPGAEGITSVQNEGGESEKKVAAAVPRGKRVVKECEKKVDATAGKVRIAKKRKTNRKGKM